MNKNENNPLYRHMMDKELPKIKTEKDLGDFMNELSEEGFLDDSRAEIYKKAYEISGASAFGVSFYATGVNEHSQAFLMLRDDPYKDVSDDVYNWMTDIDSCDTSEFIQPIFFEGFEKYQDDETDEYLFEKFAKIPNKDLRTAYLTLLCSDPYDKSSFGAKMGSCLSDIVRNCPSRILYDVRDISSAPYEDAPDAKKKEGPAK